METKTILQLLNDYKFDFCLPKFGLHALFLLLMSVCLVSTKSAFADCSQLLLGVDLPHPSWLKEERVVTHTVGHTVAVGPIMPTHRTAESDNNFWFRITRKDGRNWFSEDGPYVNAPQGDPRWPFMILGPEIATILGFKMFDEKTILVPSVARINQGIENLNSLLPEGQKILFRFYEQSGNSHREYLQRFSDNFEVPINTDDFFLAVHDLSFHLSIIVAPIGLQYRTHLFAKTFRELIKNNSDLTLVAKKETTATEIIDVMLAATTLSRAGRNSTDDDHFLSMMSGLNFERQTERLLLSLAKEDEQKETPDFINRQIKNFRFRLNLFPGIGLKPPDFYRASMERRAQIMRLLRRQ